MACFDQGNWPHCTLYAISMAVSKACLDCNVQISDNDVRKLLLQIDDIFMKCRIQDGFFPSDFNDKELRFIDYNRDEYLLYTIKVQEIERRRFNDRQRAVKYIIVVVQFLGRDRSHAMYIMCSTERSGIKYFRCLNSMEAGGRELEIPFDQDCDELFKVSIHLQDQMTPNLGSELINQPETIMHPPKIPPSVVSPLINVNENNGHEHFDSNGTIEGISDRVEKPQDFSSTQHGACSGSAGTIVRRSSRQSNKNQKYTNDQWTGSKKLRARRVKHRTNLCERMKRGPNKILNVKKCVNKHQLDSVREKAKDKATWDNAYTLKKGKDLSASDPIINEQKRKLRGYTK